jgi:hypothetical protein
MACFPKIDQPCPLGIDEQKRIDGWCGRCAKNVHALDGMSSDDRRALLRGASGPICVSYRRPVARGFGVGLGAALAMSVSASALAIDGLPTGPATDPALSSVEKGQPSPFGDKAEGPKCDEAEKVAVSADAMSLNSVLLTGGISNPADAEWIDDSDLPDLPMVSAAAQPDP